MEREPIVLNDYGVVLRQLTHDKIEMVRQWRNSPQIQQTMFFQDEITPDMQARWFMSLDPRRDLYFIISYKNDELGVINVKSIDFDNRSGEAGVFVYEERYLATDIAYRAHLVLFDYMFGQQGLKCIYSHIRRDNQKALRFAQFMGSLPDEERSTEDGLFLTLTFENYLNNPNRKRFINKWNRINLT